MGQAARITGKVEYRQGDGTNLVIRPGPCEVEETLLDATLSWTEGDAHGLAAMPIADFKRYVARHAIEYVPAAPAA
jgi:hypothetical protein